VQGHTADPRRNSTTASALKSGLSPEQGGPCGGLGGGRGGATGVGLPPTDAGCCVPFPPVRHALACLKSRLSVYSCPGRRDLSPKLGTGEFGLHEPAGASPTQKLSAENFSLHGGAGERRSF
jgi:hypothetical protein